MKEMHILAVDHLGEDREALGLALSQALGITVYEARGRIAGAGAGPVVISSFGDKLDADKKAKQLRAAGISPLILGQDEIETDDKRIIARTFILAETELVVGARTGKEVRMAYSGIAVIIRGTRITHTTRTETKKSTKFAPDRAILSGGLMLTKSVEVTSTTSTDARDGFFHLYGTAIEPIAFLESGVLYDSLGPALQLTRTANFARLIGELRQRCTAALFDDLLINRPGQARLLGPLFTPEAHLDIAISVLARSLRS
jgi:hypothetical protein